MYIRVLPGQFVARVLGSARELSMECSGLTHPRSLIGNFDAVVVSLTKILVETQATRFLFIQPRALVHLTPAVEGGYTQPELRAFRQAALAAGYVAPLMCGSEFGPLTDQEIMGVVHQLRA